MIPLALYRTFHMGERRIRSRWRKESTRGWPVIVDWSRTLISMPVRYAGLNLIAVEAAHVRVRTLVQVTSCH